MKICCVETRRLPAAWTGGTAALPLDFFSYVSLADIRWVERAEAETNGAYKQIIPYVVVRQSNGLALCYPRHGAERRLRGLYSCGIGGHIDIRDARETLAGTIRAGMLRELSEELADFAEGRISLAYRGVIHDAETGVGRVHLGLVYAAQCCTGYTPRPAEELAGMVWKTPEELGEMRRERWSDLALRLVLRPGGSQGLQNG
ncbi:MAG: hypothetical protein LBD37_07715 [Treponema sp.]|jgi:predicted NUDIX family phosphoesterase|nr:hypothetical protein [Treponema sp.]